MVKETLTFGNIKIEEKNVLPLQDSYFFGELEILRKYWYLTRFLMVIKPVNTLSVTCITVIKLNHST